MISDDLEICSDLSLTRVAQLGWLIEVATHLGRHRGPPAELATDPPGHRPPAWCPPGCSMSKQAALGFRKRSPEEAHLSLALPSSKHFKKLPAAH